MYSHCLKIRVRLSFQRLTLYQTSNRQHPIRNVICRAHSVSSQLEEPSVPQLENHPSNNESAPRESQEEILAQSLGSNEALVKLAEEIARSSIPEGSRKINGKYIQSHLLSPLEALLEKLKVQTKDIEVAQSKVVSIFWVGLTASVQVLGTFDGWSQGEHLSPEYTGSFT